MTHTYPWLKKFAIDNAGLAAAARHAFDTYGKRVTAPSALSSLAVLLSRRGVVSAVKGYLRRFAPLVRPGSRRVVAEEILKTKRLSPPPEYAIVPGLGLSHIAESYGTPLPPGMATKLDNFALVHELGEIQAHKKWGRLGGVSPVGGHVNLDVLLREHNALVTNKDAPFRGVVRRVRYQAEAQPGGAPLHIKYTFKGEPREWVYGKRGRLSRHERKAVLDSHLKWQAR